MKLLGERIRARRLRLGLSIDDVAKRSASSIHLIKELEWSMRSDIELTTLQSIAEAMDQSMAELLIEDSVITSNSLSEQLNPQS